MEYPQQVWLAVMLSVLTTYVLSGWVQNRTVTSCYHATGEGDTARDGSHPYLEDKKPYNSGEPRAST